MLVNQSSLKNDRLPAQPDHALCVQTLAAMEGCWREPPGTCCWCGWKSCVSSATRGFCGPVDCGVECWRNRCFGITMWWRTWVGGTLKTGPRGVWTNWWVISDNFIAKDGRFATSPTLSLPPSILFDWCWLFWAIHKQGWPTHWQTVGKYI